MTAASVRWIRAWPDQGPPQSRIGRAGDQVIAEWTGLGTLRANLDGTSSEFVPAGRADAGAVEELLRSRVSPLLRHLRGGVSFHASSVARGGVAIMFVGESWAGKSTMAAHLCRDTSTELLADNVTELEVDGPLVNVAPTEARHGLRPDMARAFGVDPLERPKVFTPAAQAASCAVRLGAAVALEVDDTLGAPTLHRLTGGRAFSSLSRAMFRFVLDDDSRLNDDLARLARVRAQAPCYELRRGRAPSNLSPTISLASELLRSLSSRDGLP